MEAATKTRVPAYRTGLDESIRLAGMFIGAEWNQRFVKALKARGLVITAPSNVPADFLNDNLYPDGHPYQAPHPFPNDSEELEWEERSLVVWEDDQTILLYQEIAQLERSIEKQKTELKTSA